MNREQIVHLASLLDSAVARLPSDGPRLQCPFRFDLDKHPSTDKGSPTFTVSVSPGEPSLAHCFRCKEGGSLINVLKRASYWARTKGAMNWCNFLWRAFLYAKEVDVGGIYGALAHLHNKTNQLGAHAPKEKSETDHLKSYATSCQRVNVHPCLIEKGITEADADKWSIGHDVNINYSTFPVLDEDLQFVGVSRRRCGSDGPKYHDLPLGQWKNEVFYGEPFVDPTLGIVHLVEGITSTIAAAKIVPNVCGLLGASTQITAARLAKLKSWTNHVVLMMDSDKAGVEAVYGSYNVKGVYRPGLLQQLQQHFYTEICSFPEGEDPASLSKADFMRAYERKRIPFMDFTQRRKQGINITPTNVPHNIEWLDWGPCSS